MTYIVIDARPSCVTAGRVDSSYHGMSCPVLSYHVLSFRSVVRSPAVQPESVPPLPAEAAGGLPVQPSQELDEELRRALPRGVLSDISGGAPQDVEISILRVTILAGRVLKIKRIRFSKVQLSGWSSEARRFRTISASVRHGSVG